MKHWIIRNSSGVMVHPKKENIFSLSCSAFPQVSGTIEVILTAVKESLFFNLITKTAERICCTRGTVVQAYSDGLQSAPTYRLHHTLSRSQKIQQVCWDVSPSSTVPSEPTSSKTKSWSFSLFYTHAERERNRKWAMFLINQNRNLNSNQNFVQEN